MAVSQGHSTAGITDTQLLLLRHMHKIGVVFHRKKKAPYYYVTPYAALLGSTSTAPASKEQEAGFLVIETNFHVYAYTESELKVSLLYMFADIRYRLPTMAVARITRGSIRRAIQQGIQACQILRFLQVAC